VLRRLGWTLLSAVIGYLFGVMAGYLAVSIAFVSRVNRLSVRPDRDRWAFVFALAGLVIGALWGWWWAGRRAGVDDRRRDDGSGDDGLGDGGPGDAGERSDPTAT
jgi:H+/Cl- antiporter ClcA